jgi:hypothetical protein
LWEVRFEREENGEEKSCGRDWRRGGGGGGLIESVWWEEEEKKEEEEDRNQGMRRGIVRLGSYGRRGRE